MLDGTTWFRRSGEPNPRGVVTLNFPWRIKSCDKDQNSDVNLDSKPNSKQLEFVHALSKLEWPPVVYFSPIKRVIEVNWFERDFFSVPRLKFSIQYHSLTKNQNVNCQFPAGNSRNSSLWTKRRMMSTKLFTTPSSVR